MVNKSIVNFITQSKTDLGKCSVKKNSFANVKKIPLFEREANLKLKN